MKKEVCPFFKVCKGYAANNYTCNHNEHKFFCGWYNLHKAAVLRVEMTKMLKGTEFGALAE